MQVTGNHWLERVTIAISAKADGSNATPLGNAKVNRRGIFTFAKALTAPIPNPLYVVVKEKRTTVVVAVNVIAAPAPEFTPTITPIP